MKKDTTTKQTAKTIDNVIADIKYGLQNCKLKKTGNNKFAGFNYFELGDFLPQLTQLIHDNGANDMFTIEKGDNDDMWAVLRIKYNDKTVSTCMPFKEYSAPKGMQEIQYLGGLMTYYRRYLYMAMFNISESDLVDSLDNEKAKPVVKPEPKKQEVKHERTEKELENKVNQEQIEFLKKIGYEGDFDNLTVKDALGIVDAWKMQKTEEETKQPEPEQSKQPDKPATDKQKMLLARFFKEGKWNGDIEYLNHISAREASEVLSRLVTQGKED